MQEKLPIISVIIPVYNKEETLNMTMDSVLEQNLDEVEVLLINDGSTDRSKEICDQYSEKYEKIRAIDKENGGVSSTRNLGIEKSKGEYIYFLDAGDSLEKNMLNIVLEQIKIQKVDILEFGFNMIIGNQNEIENDDVQDLVARYSEDAIKEYVSSKAISIYIWSKLYSRSAIGNLRFREDVSLAEDIVFNAQVVGNVKSILFINTKLYNYIVDMNSLSRDVTIKSLEDLRKSTYLYKESLYNLRPELNADILATALQLYIATFNRALGCHGRKNKDVAVVVDKIVEAFNESKRDPVYKTLSKKMRIAIFFATHNLFISEIVCKTYWKIKEKRTAKYN